MRVQAFVIEPEGEARPVWVDAKLPPLSSRPTRVTLTKDCRQLCPPGWPAPPDQVGSGGHSTWHPRTIPSGTTIRTFACCANALVAAGAATLAP